MLGIAVKRTDRGLSSRYPAFSAEIPEALAAEVGAAKPEQVAEIGENWARQQSEELLSADVRGLHFYIMSTADQLRRVPGPPVQVR